MRDDLPTPDPTLKPWNVWEAIDATSDMAYDKQQAQIAERARLLAERTGEHESPEQAAEDEPNAGEHEAKDENSGG